VLLRESAGTGEPGNLMSDGEDSSNESNEDKAYKNLKDNMRIVSG
jgi:hypothetical protein